MTTTTVRATDDTHLRTILTMALRQGYEPSQAAPDHVRWHRGHNGAVLIVELPESYI